MSSFKELQEVQHQIEERIGVLREGFGVLETDFARLHDEEKSFEFELDQHADNLLRNALRDELDRIKDLVTESEAKFEPAAQSFRDLTHQIQEDASALSEHVSHRTDSHHQLHSGMEEFGHLIEQAGSEFEAQGHEFLAQVGTLANELEHLAQGVFASGDQLSQSIQETQAHVLEQATQAFTELLGTHMESLLPGQFEQTLSNLQHGVQDLGSQCNTIGTAFQNELETLLQHVGEFATQEVHNKIEEKFQKLLHEAVAFLAQQIAESIAETTAGAAITGAMAPILPELAALKVATEIIKEAIQIWNDLKAATGGIL